MTLSFDLIDKCASCVYKNASPSEGWCYLFSQAPLVACEKFIMTADARVIDDINTLERAFPDKFGE